MKNYVVFMLSLFVSLAVNGRDKDFQDKTYTVYLNFPEYSVRASVLHHNGKQKPKKQYTYYWLALNTIQHTQGGFDGKLLHGEYKAFYLTNALKEQGNFRNGLKTGVWKLWYPNGVMAEETEYENGFRHGDSKMYDAQGRMTTYAHYRHDVLHGSFTKFTYGDSLNKRRTMYKHGEEVLPKTKKAPRDTSAAKKKSDTTKTKTPADTTASKKKLFGKAKKEKQPAQPAKPEKQRKPLFRKKQEAEPPKPSSNLHQP